jgi:hypothetical protein
MESIGANRLIAFEEEDASIRSEIADIHAAHEEYDLAAKIL